MANYRRINKLLIKLIKKILFNNSNNVIDNLCVIINIRYLFFGVNLISQQILLTRNNTYALTFECMK